MGKGRLNEFLQLDGIRHLPGGQKLQVNGECLIQE